MNWWMNRWERIKLVGKFIGWGWVILITVVMVLATLTTMIIADNVALRRENGALIDKNVKLQIENWKLGTTVDLCPPAIKSIYVAKD